MKHYGKLESGDGRFITSIKKRLAEARKSTCAGCLRKVWAPNLDVYAIDDQKPADDRNLVLLDRQCRDSIVSNVFMLYCSADNGRPEWHKWVYGGQRNPLMDGRRPRRNPRLRLPDPNDYRADSGRLPKLRISDEGR